ncbi:transcriptional regulator, GntR family [Roseovarius azorensis]|uniref:Transcriptional regulator, GntR family n=1 Tax=Roseovarius azorensis TaxID=1287727 RepID=A0A1H7J9R9_9RHOB|nr:UTRA domain-containing protein [Roseovarius azorensis]SEK70005.1 transcriptional regulator, GntR family [Roseovarius azorensis]
MTPPQFNSWQSIQDEVLRRIHAREWPPGTVIPNEADLAQDFGCARATVNRALRALADAGILERRRKAGTRVALHPVSRATVDIPLIRQEITARGLVYAYRHLSRRIASPPRDVAATLCAGTPCEGLHVTALHLASDAPFVFEDRWISLTTAPAAAAQGFETLSANEWLISTIPYTHGDIRFSAEVAPESIAELLGTSPGAPIFVVERTTWDHTRAITTVRLNYAPGYSITTGIGTPS